MMILSIFGYKNSDKRLGLITDSIVKDIIDPETFEVTNVLNYSKPVLIKKLQEEKTV